ncbi:hypothetical protein [Leptospira idonii]|uniref:Lipoprotein n=1 Tax=Leptospira idonii TaxID=1193500 RepID=A0A4R9LZZ6_9LEPT|nr:hypothetical protein [Leptospira idonii]TGN19963.1 hypothetical protein EHS15_06190 [Leptospira idonii]
MTRNIIFLLTFSLTTFFISCQGMEVKKQDESIRLTYDIWSGLVPFSLASEHSQEMESSWKIMNETRKKIENFAESQSFHPKQKTILYPFSGIDVLNLFSFFPKGERYILFGLEDPGYPFDWDSKSDSEKKTVLSGIRNLSSHLAGRNYFTYRKMKEETKKPALSGAYPVFVAFLRRLGKEITDSKFESIESAKGTWKGFTIEFYDPAIGKKQTLTYFKIFLTGKEGEPGDGLYEYFSSLGPKAIFTKSAEYLFHGEKREKFRSLLLKDTELVVQDDSGFPLRFFPKENWERTLFGRYEKSWNLSGAVEPESQTELKEISKEIDNPPLPFPFGYGFLGTKDNKQSSILVARKK